MRSLFALGSSKAQVPAARCTLRGMFSRKYASWVTHQRPQDRAGMSSTTPPASSQAEDPIMQKQITQRTGRGVGERRGFDEEQESAKPTKKEANSRAQPKGPSSDKFPWPVLTHRTPPQPESRQTFLSEPFLMHIHKGHPKPIELGPQRQRKRNFHASSDVTVRSTSTSRK